MGATTSRHKKDRQVELRDIAKIKPYPGNARTHTDEQVDQIVASINEWGWTNPIITDPKGMILAGHGRYQAALRLDLDKVPVIIARGWSDAQKKAYVLADNKLAENAGWDLSLLRTELKELRGLDFELGTIGFSAADLKKLLHPKSQNDPDAVPSVEQLQTTMPGDVWTLGDHRIMCGDCTADDEVMRLLDGAKSSLCLTDPPYGVGKRAESEKNNYAQYHDTRQNLENLAAGWLPIARRECPVVVFSCGVTNQWIYPEPDWVMCWFYGAGQLRSPWGFNCWQPFLCYGKEPGLAARKGARPDAVDMNVPASAADIDHPCPKPMKLWEWMLDRLVFDHGAVFDPFLGSGTTIIACESKALACMGMEIDPKYCDVSIRRWEQFTGRNAVLESTGQTFAEVEDDRKTRTH